MLRTRSAGLLIAALLGAAIPRPAGSAVRLDPLHNDNGTYRVYLGDRFLGTEKFSLEPRGDSVLVFAEVNEQIPTPDGDQKLAKKAMLAIKTLDYDLLSYSSEQTFMGRKLVRGLSPSDTTFTTYRENESVGAGDTYERPPGRVFVIDSQVFVLFDVLLRSLHGKMFERPISVVVLGDRDTVLDLMCRPGPTETVQVQGKPQPARRVSLSDGTTDFVAWVATSGQMLRFELPAAGFRVERQSLVSKKIPNPTAKAAAPAGAPPPKVSPPSPAPAGKR
jgi:hypothetical protein